MASPYEGMTPLSIQHPAYPCKRLSLVERPETPPPDKCNPCGFKIIPDECNPCGFEIIGFRYNHCSYNLHPYCAGIPPDLYIQHTHLPGPPHLATLMFFPPYLTGKFTCDICGKLGGSHWLYRCTVCNDFDAHLGCAMNAAQHQYRVRPQYYLPTNPVRGPYNNGGGGDPPVDPWRQFVMWAFVRLADLAFGTEPTRGLSDLGPTLFNTLNQLLQHS